MDPVNVEVHLALLQEKQQRDEERIEVLEKKLAEMDRSILKGQIYLSAFVAVGALIGWFLSAVDKIKTWFH